MSSAILVHVVLDRNDITIQDKINEAYELLSTHGSKIIHTYIVKCREINSATLIGTGKVEEISDFLQDIDNAKVDIVVINCTVPPIQQRNLEKAWKRRVVDRVALIIDIFAKRARTLEGRLQVDLAKAIYQKSMLVKMWSHLERQRGAVSFVGGPGEKQIELDRRLLDGQIVRLRQKLDKVKRTRALQRNRRVRNNNFVIGLIGYTNAGKSSLFNLLTLGKNNIDHSSKKVLVDNQLFATLDPTVHTLKTDLYQYHNIEHTQEHYPNVGNILISDTVGFISDLPPQLIEAFSATLEEMRSADLLLHVQDATCVNWRNKASEVFKILQKIGATQRIISVYNKIDLFDDVKSCPSFLYNGEDTTIFTSVKNGYGMDNLLKTINMCALSFYNPKID